MLIFDQLKHDNRKLRAISIGVITGMLVLFGGLWWVQIVSAKRYETNLKSQSFRSVRVPALRGKIMDRNGVSLAENRPRFDVNIYLEDLRDEFTYAYTNHVKPEFLRQHPGVKLNGEAVAGLGREARYRVISNIVAQITTKLQDPQILDPDRFARHYYQTPYIPFPVLQNLTPKQVAIFAENFTGMNGVEMEIQPMRTYPNGTSASHLLGWIQRHDRPIDEEEIECKYFLPDYIGRTGVEAAFDSALRGKAGVKSLLINNLGYRQREEMISPTEPGKDLLLTIDLRIQQAAEKALASALANVKGAAIVMDVRNGDVLAMASAPDYDPNLFPGGISSEDWARLNNEQYSHMFNRATYGAYPPGSVLKILTSLAGLETGVMHPNDIYHLQMDPEHAPKGCIYVDRRKIKDTANAGDYDFERAFLKSSNGYFVHYGMKAGFRKLVEIYERFHLGESTGILPREEASGDCPHLSEQRSWTSGRIANLCIGQEITVTPIQVATMISAIANGGRLYWPRIVKDLQTPGAEEEASHSVQPGILRADLHLNPRHVQLIQQAMLADVEDSEGTGRAAAVEGMRVTGKTGTAQVRKAHGMDHVTWFVSFAPYEKPKYAVVVMVQSGSSGGGTCAPVAHQIYEAILKVEQNQLPASTLATSN